MALVLLDRVQQTGTANTTVSFTLSGSVTGFQSFSVVGDGNTTYYSATDSSGNWEVGIGTYTTAGTLLTRTTILSSSNSGSAVTFSGTVNVFVTYPSGKSVNQDASGNVGIGTSSPNAKLDVAVSSGQNLALTKTGGAYLSFYEGTTLRATVNGLSSADGLMFTTGTAATERMRIDSSGKVGIGTSTYNSNFTVLKGGTSTTANSLFGGGSCAALIGGEVGLILSSNIVAATGLNSATETAKGGMNFTYFSSAAPTELCFGIDGTPAVASNLRFYNGTERMRIFSSGGVSVGNTTDPGATNLSVTGTVAGSNITTGGNVTGSSASCTGNAATATTATNWGTYGAVPAAGTSFATANTIGRSDANGYTFFGYINSSTAASENPAVSQVIVTNSGDNYYRKSSIASFTTYLSGTASSLTAGACSGNAVTATTAANLTTGSSIKRTAAGTGWLDGQYAGVESVSTSGAIYSIGGSYVPGTTTLGNMYGIGYGYSGNAGITATGAPSSLWGMYVASAGVSRIFLSGDAGNAYFNGSLYAGANVTAYSDERVKTNWRPLSDNFVANLAQIKSGIYDRTDMELTQVGVGAQSLQKIMPNAITVDEKGMLAIAYGQAAMASCVELAKVIGELRAEIKELKRK
jgi:hypothetical protein